MCVTSQWPLAWLVGHCSKQHGLSLLGWSAVLASCLLNILVVSVIYDVTRSVLWPSSINFPVADNSFSPAYTMFNVFLPKLLESKSSSDVPRRCGLYCMDGLSRYSVQRVCKPFSLNRSVIDMNFSLLLVWGTACGIASVLLRVYVEHSISSTVITYVLVIEVA